ncbi:mRNA-degrading endonuclease toxin of MazEF toxin-antitoxin module [Edaphobacter lichenicola]|uniref:mRNA-degrading endonuclease toxin of MazEF toxin-antitoxin module n=2 Tax=Tunturiibacter TaxID=3154218 RepID=A0A7Y9NR12_9BACT|nr:mRNA-degrading endonuclease toxin of MazEF toxin-antitoxin module [Edaphobacter lichenicola]
MIVVSANRINHGELIVCVPLTSEKSKHANKTIPAHDIRIPAALIIPVSTEPPIPRDSIALCEQVTCCDRTRLVQHWATLTPDALEAVKIGLQNVLGF